MTVFNVGDVLGTQEAFCLKVEDIVTGRTFIASITRWGKSWTTRKIVESCVGHAGIIILDQEGEYSSLREKFPFLIIGKDVPLQIETAEFMAEKMLESKINVIVDTSMVEDEETAKEYINLFLRKFFFLETTQRQPYLVVVEEAEDLAGEKGIGTQTCLGIMINIVKKGGKRGIGAMFIAHRPAWISKGILSQCMPAGEKVITSDGLKPIETVKIGDLVFTHKGRYQKVTNTFSREYTGQLVEIRTRGWNGVTRVTPEHPFLIRYATKPYSRYSSERYAQNKAG